jgi:hypothetical protein
MDSQKRFNDVLTESQIQYINGLPEVDAARHRIENGAKVSYFSIELTDSIKATLQERLGLDLSAVNKVPLRWICGDTAPHVDVGSSTFDNTYLLYLNDNPGEFILDGVSHPISANTSYVFNEGLSHETINTGTEPRLLLGPMNEFAQPVGGAVVYYYASEADALANTNVIIAMGSYQIQTIEGYDNSWRIASNSTGSSPQNIVYSVGDILAGTYNNGGQGDVLYYLYPSAQSEGDPVTFYYPSEADALADTNLIISYGNYNIVSVSGYNYWRIASNSTGPSLQNRVYNVGNVLSGINPGNAIYYLYPSAPCFLEGTTILCKVDGIEKYVPVEELKNGTLAKTSCDGFKPVVAIGKASIQNPGTNERIENRLYKCSTSKYPELKEDLYITGCHSILVFPLTEKQKEDTIKHLGKLFVTDKKYRLMACVDDRAEPWNSEGKYTIYHIALENNDEKMNYGVYVNGGLLVETCSINYLKNRSDMRII